HRGVGAGEGGDPHALAGGGGVAGGGGRAVGGRPPLPADVVEVRARHRTRKSTSACRVVAKVSFTVRQGCLAGRGIGGEASGSRCCGSVFTVTASDLDSNTHCRSTPTGPVRCACFPVAARP